MIVVEGPDGAGKTTLIRTLQEHLDLPIAPRVVTKYAEAMVDLREWVDRNLAEGFQQTIFDRHRLISETIYGPILRDEQESGFSELSWLAPRMKQFYQIQPIIIYCLPPLAEVRHNVWQGEDNIVVQAQINKIYSAYVARASADYAANRAIVKVWDYTKSLNVKGKPSWIPSLKTTITDRLASL